MFYAQHSAARSQFNDPGEWNEASCEHHPVEDLEPLDKVKLILCQCQCQLAQLALVTLKAIAAVQLHSCTRALD